MQDKSEVCWETPTTRCSGNSSHGRRRHPSSSDPQGSASVAHHPCVRNRAGTRAGDPTPTCFSLGWWWGWPMCSHSPVLAPCWCPHQGRSMTGVQFQLPSPGSKWSHVKTSFHTELEPKCRHRWCLDEKHSQQVMLVEGCVWREMSTAAWTSYARVGSDVLYRTACKLLCVVVPLPGSYCPCKRNNLYGKPWNQATQTNHPKFP